MRKTKIVATIGPACCREELLMQMIQAGLDVARLNFSHGTHAEHGMLMARVRQAAQKVGKAVALMLDTKGPEIRLGILSKGQVSLQAGQEIFLTPENIEGNDWELPITYAGLAQKMQVGDRILLADGLIELRVLQIQKARILCRVQNNGKVSSRQGVNVPGVRLELPAISEQDREDLRFGAEQKVDFVAASFTRKAEDIREIREFLRSQGSSAQIIAKIENQEGLDNLEDILAEADGIMIARGDLGVEIPPEEIPPLQKLLVNQARRRGKMAIVATQMLESMLNQPRPTRAEASDVANAVFEQTDAVMLSGETALGQFPLEAIQTIAKIIVQAEKVEEKPLPAQTGSLTDAVSHAACTMAQDLQAKAIISVTKSGYTARLISKYRPHSLIVAATPSAIVERQLNLVWGVYPLLIPEPQNLLAEAEKAAGQAGFVKPGDLAVITAGSPQSQQTNFIQLCRIEA